MTLLTAVETEDKYYLAADKVTTKYASGVEYSDPLQYPKIITSKPAGHLMAASAGSHILSDLLREALQGSGAIPVGVETTTADQLVKRLVYLLEEQPLRYSGIQLAATSGEDTAAIPGNILLINQEEGIVGIDSNLSVIKLQSKLVASGPAEGIWLGAMHAFTKVPAGTEFTPHAIRESYQIANSISPSSAGANCDINSIPKT